MHPPHRKQEETKHARRRTACTTRFARRSTDQTAAMVPLSYRLGSFDSEVCKTAYGLDRGYGTTVLPSGQNHAIETEIIDYKCADICR